MLDGHPFNIPLFELYCAPIYAPIAHHFFMNVHKHLSSFRSLQAQKMRYSFIFNDLCQTVKNSIGLVANHYFKFYRPKHEAAGLDEDDYDYDEANPYGDMETEEETEDEE